MSARPLEGNQGGTAEKIRVRPLEVWRTYRQGMGSILLAQARQAPSCLHEMVFVGRKNMEHESAECSKAKTSRWKPTRAQARQAPSCLHEMVFVGRKNMEHESAECSYEI